MLSLVGNARAQLRQLSDVVETLRQEMQFQRADRWSLRAPEKCPAWLDIDHNRVACRMYEVEYRGAFLAGILVEHDKPTDELVIYSAGHESERETARWIENFSVKIVQDDAAGLIGRLVARGANVLITFMPGLGPGPTTGSSTLGRIYDLMSDHRSLVLLDNQGDSAATFFVAHIKLFLDRHSSNYRRIRMFGRSGGGWSATFAAAFDTRIQCSVSLFGTLPMRLRLPLADEEPGPLRDFGDYEQFGLVLYKRLDYLDLYAAAAYPSRRHAQVYNAVDDCCFNGNGKGDQVMTQFRSAYPSVKGFSTKILERSGAKVHGSMDGQTWDALMEVCPVGIDTEDR